ncbi:rCG30170 [Rattus norvegicus]|uniref:RCG30170 n=1 Tax=Rattus norvegicus TaxID=10116 RepID=A6IMD5_RAT|nr:rCG30170 [Rattus norvegicus]
MMPRSTKDFCLHTYNYFFTLSKLSFHISSEQGHFLCFLVVFRL